MIIQQMIKPRDDIIVSLLSATCVKVNGVTDQGALAAM